MPIGCRLMLLALLAWVLLGAAAAQEIASAPSSPTGPIHLAVVVTPKSGSLAVGNLTKQEFTVLDNKAPQPITSFQAMGGPEAPIEVILVIDAVNTSYQNIGFERGQLATFLKANGGHLAHPTALAVLTDTGTQIQQGFSTDGDAVNAALEHYTVALRDVTRSAGFYGATERFQLSLKALSALASSEAGRPGRKIVLWLSPGWPLLSGPGVQLDSKQMRELFASIVDLSTRLRQAQVTLYSIDSLGVDEGVGRTLYYQEFVKGVSKPSQVNIGDLSLQALAVQSGGLALSSTGVADLLQKCIADTDAYYEMTFNALPAEQRDQYHQIEVKVAQPGLVARTRQGYYAQP